MQHYRGTNVWSSLLAGAGTIRAEDFAMKHFVFGAFAALLLLGSARAQTIEVNKANRTIAITTTASASALADTARITIGFQVFAPDAETAYRNGTQLSSAIMEALKKSGVPDKAIQSASQSLTRTDFPYNDKTPAAERTRRQFTLSQSWTVTTRANQAAAVIRVSVAAGANDSGNIDWEFSSRDALQAKAAEEALVQARAIATQMAGGLGAHLGPLLYASNQTPMQRSIAMATASGVLGGGVGRLASLAILPQKVEASATVYAVFSIE
jgi:uncharacterized protein YggE